MSAASTTHAQTPSSEHRPPGRTAVVSWALWDWGSAAFNAVIITFVFAPYLTSSVAEDPDSGSSALGWSMAAAGLVIALVAPAAGVRADSSGRHRLWLGVHTGVVVASMIGLFAVKDSPEYLWLGLLLLAVGSIFFEFAEVSYNSVLVAIAKPETMGRISGFGWGMGYLGGLALLVLLLVTVISPEVGLFGAVDDEGLRYRIVAVIAGVWFAVFAVPVLLTAPKATSAGKGAASGPLEGVRAFVRDYGTLIRRIRRMWREDRMTLRFLLASAVFRDGLAAIFAFAGVLAAGSYGFSASEVIVLGVVANIVAGIGAISAGLVDDRFGPKAVIVVGLVCLCAGGLPIVLSDSVTVFWVCAVFLCLFVGPVQSASRSYLARVTTPETAGEAFGLYATTGRAVSFLGPAAFAGFVTLLGYQRAGALGIVLVLLLGLILTLPLRAPKAETLADVGVSKALR